MLLTMENLRYFSVLLTVAAFIMNCRVLSVAADDPPCYLINYDTVNLTRASYWEIDWSDTAGCLGGSESCKFFFAVCKPLPVVITGEGPQCPNSSVCLEILPKEKNETSQFHSIGNYTANPYDGESSTQFWAKYPVGQPYKYPNGTTCQTWTTLHFFCDENRPWLPAPAAVGKVPAVKRVTYFPDKCLHVISMPFAGACSRGAVPVPNPHSISPGSVLLILFICSVSVYLIGGVGYNRNQGAQGREMLPHYDFWQDQIKNVKAGFNLTCIVLTCREIPTQSPTYEQL